MAELAPRRGGKVCEVVEIGKYYEIPTVNGKFFDFVADWPVLGPRHEDREIIGFKYEHYHFDFRFMPDEVWKSIERLSRAGRAAAAAWVLTDRVGRAAVGPVVWRRRKCRRAMPEFPEHTPGDWQPNLVAAYRDHRLPDSLICPHRGVPLRGQPVVGGCVTCPAHGLRWDLRARRLAGVSDVLD